MKALRESIQDLLVIENERLRAELANIQAELTEAQRQLITVQQVLGNAQGENAQLKEQLAWFQRQLFGKKSEKIVTPSPEQLLLPGFPLPNDSQEEKKKREVAAHTRGAPKRKGQDAITLSPDLPVETKTIDLTEKEKICPVTGQALVKIGEEVQDKLAFKPGSYFIKRLVRIKYASKAAPESGVRIPALPPALLPRCQADESLLANIAVKKFADHLPLYRIAEALGRENIGISRQILCEWLQRTGQALMPLVEAMHRKVLSFGSLFVDEIPVKMQEPGKGKLHQGYMWVVCGGKEADPPYRTYHFRLSRAHDHVNQLLKGYEGAVHSDKYDAYMKLAADPKITWCPCWAHIRRKFIEIEDGDIPLKEEVLLRIRHLFIWERIAWGRSAEERLEMRATREEPIIDALIELIEEKHKNNRILPKSKLWKALNYFFALIPYLKNYLKLPYARLDNNVAERAVRPLALGRKNWLFLGSREGGRVAATFFSLIQTCRAFGINPQEYLEDVMRRLPTLGNDLLEELLPDKWAKARASP